MPIYVLVAQLIGLFAGWFDGMPPKGRGLGLIGNMIIGLVGALIGGVLVDTLARTHNRSISVRKIGLLLVSPGAD